MIGYIKGRVTALFKDFCFLETGGIGYRIFISDKTRQQLAPGEEAKLEMIGNRSCYLTKRFDREQDARIHFASAMTMVGKQDGDDASFLGKHGLNRCQISFLDFYTERGII